jgi:hypothetical protein
MKTKPVKKGTKGTAPPRPPDDDEHRKLLDRARSEKDRREIERMRDVIAASRRKVLR